MTIFIVEACHSTLSCRWTELNRTELDCRGSYLEFQLHRLNFLALCLLGRGSEALIYSKTHFNRFFNKHLKGMDYIVTHLFFH